MAVYGYARVSTTDQNLTIQREALKAAGCEVIRSEKISGTSRQGREELATLMDFLRSGDTFVVTRLDRLARSARDLHNIVHELDQRGVILKATEQSVDTSGSAGKAFIGMVAVFAEFEADIRRERQMEGIARAKAKGVYKGRKASIDGEAVKAMKAQGLGATEISKRLGIGRASVYRVLKAA